MRLSAPFLVPPLISNDGCWSGPGVHSADGLLRAMSWPAENIGPAPPRITTRTVSSASAARNASSSSTRRPRFCALRVLGRFKHDPRDPAVIDRLVVDVLVVRHGCVLLGGTGPILRPSFEGGRRVQRVSSLATFACTVTTPMAPPPSRAAQLLRSGNRPGHTSDSTSRSRRHHRPRLPATPGDGPSDHLPSSPGPPSPRALPWCSSPD